MFNYVKALKSKFKHVKRSTSRVDTNSHLDF